MYIIYTRHIYIYIYKIPRPQTLKPGLLLCVCVCIVLANQFYTVGVLCLLVPICMCVNHAFAFALTVHPYINVAILNANVNTIQTYKRSPSLMKMSFLLFRECLAYLMSTKSDLQYDHNKQSILSPQQMTYFIPRAKVLLSSQHIKGLRLIPICLSACQVFLFLFTC